MSAVEKTQTDLDELNKVTVERLGAVKSELTGKIQGRNSNALLNIPLSYCHRKLNGELDFIFTRAIELCSCVG